MLRLGLAKLAAAKVLVIGVASATALVGVAMTAEAGALPAGLQGIAHRAIGAPSAGPAAHRDTDGDDADDPTATPSSSATGTPSASPTHLPRHQHTLTAADLCRGYLLASAKQQAAAIAHKPFSALVTAAGSADKISSYCVALVGRAPTLVAPLAVFCMVVDLDLGRRFPFERHLGDRVDHPTGTPTAHPTGTPTARPTGSWTAHPTEHPTGTRTEHPTGTPTAHPTSDEWTGLRAWTHWVHWVPCGMTTERLAPSGTLPTTTETHTPHPTTFPTGKPIVPGTPTYRPTGTPTHR